MAEKNIFDKWGNDVIIFFQLPVDKIVILKAVEKRRYQV